MAINKCRICGHKFFSDPLLYYRNMPKSAQYLPEGKDLECDKGVDLKICQCAGCGLIQLSSEPVTYYKEVIRSVGISEEMKEFRKSQLDAIVQKYSLKGKKVIEIGCGRGEYLSIMKQADVDAFGLEESSVSVDICLNRGLNVSKGFIDSSEDILNNAPFDAFLMFNFLEHLPNPNSTLSGINNNLTQNAIGLIEVPNFDINRKTLFSEFIKDHLLYFTKDTFFSTLRQNGYEVLEYVLVWHESILSAIVKKREKADLSHFYKYQIKLKDEMEEYILKFDIGKVAIWGASHQSLTIISLFNLASKIKYVIDSAPFKQNKYTPASHVKIVSPDILDSDPVDGIIVMAALYSTEVAKIIRRKYGHKISVVILKDTGLEIV
jgi:2-polyprenyl-3-methyl-5-hydroxy-6-metoxy-1,4-benzoquinol methylase